jgi:hypothetical protein
MIANVGRSRISRVAAGAVLALGLGLGSLAACSGQGATANCTSSTSCTVTFDRHSDAPKIELLGVTVQLVSADDSSVTLSVGGKQVTVQKDSNVSVGGLTIAVDEITSRQIMLKVTRA